MEERREKHTGLVSEFIDYSAENIKFIVTLPLRIPTYAGQLKESLADPKQRPSAIQNAILTMVGVGSIGALAVIGIQDHETGKRLLIATALSFIIAMPASFWAYKSYTSNSN